MSNIGYGESTWYDTSDHTVLHEDMRHDPDATIDTVNRRPSLLRSVTACPICEEILQETGAGRRSVAPAEPRGERLHIGIGLEGLEEALLPRLNLGAGHRIVATYTERAEIAVLVIECPDGEPAHDMVALNADAA